MTAPIRYLVVFALIGAAAAATPDPARLVLRKTDLPKGYSVLRANTGRVTNAAAAQGDPELTRGFAAWGRIKGYNVEWDGGLAGAISSSAELFRTARGAKAYLAWSVANAPSRTEPQPNFRREDFCGARTAESARFKKDVSNARTRRSALP